jgi:hypothetical protein
MWFFLFLVWSAQLSSLSLPLCGENGDTFGSWLPTARYENSTVLQKHVHDRFAFGGPGSAVNFTHMWIPDECAYHRFTNSSLINVIKHIQKMKSSTEPVRVIVIGDSGTRGILCGIVRMLSGSEVVGPCENVICGTSTIPSASVMQKHKLFDVSFGPLTLSFMYIQSLAEQMSRWLVEANIHKKPYALVLNTGVWDFNEYALKHVGEIAQDLCDSAEVEMISNVRAQESIKAMFIETGALAHSLGVRAIYRTNHHTDRFGSHCADEQLLPVLKSTGWEVWDNRRLSQHMWAHQTTDGYHVERNAHTVAEHLQIRHDALLKGKPMPGMLEMQFAQSLLHMLFGDALRAMIAEGVNP